MASTIDVVSHAKAYTCDLVGNLASVTEGHTTAYAYNALDHRTSTTDGNGDTTTFTYDANGDSYTTGDDNRLLSDGSYAYLYDAEGNRTAKFLDTDADGLLDCVLPASVCELFRGVWYRGLATDDFVEDSRWVPARHETFLSGLRTFAVDSSVGARLAAPVRASPARCGPRQ